MLCTTDYRTVSFISVVILSVSVVVSLGVDGP